ncbi:MULTISPECIES: hypothetical protein [Gammaproteobacteria]|uniref:hypothetical protein n=1 Tax=Gammaproteobacteria TaxID=1236 RepID=UPI001EE0A816|nr:hypothetical protein [Psychrobacter sp. Ps4]MCG3808912.1 hypothetical protein [Psychrobacter sp. Ps4]|tara:strand:+ start:59 stop:331 length:273 start_codon:yes stop_codon:yes gene_type:complete
MSYFDGYAQGPVNINQKVKLKLTKLGQQILDDHNAEVRATCKMLANYSATKMDVDGMHIMQLHTAMRVFGGTNIRFTESPFENCVMTILR